MENYIVRIYRRSACGPEEVVGHVECVESAETLPFRGMGELVAIFSMPHGNTTPNLASALECGIKRFS